MIIFFLLLINNIDVKIDSLKAALEQNPDIRTIIQLNKYYLQKGELYNGIKLLKDYEGHFTSEKSIIIYKIGENYFFAGKIILARQEYLRLVGRFPNAEIANDALMRLFLIEQARKDTVLLKRMANSIYLFEIDQFDAAEDSIKSLLKTKIGDYAYFYLTVLYNKKDDLAQTLSALNELNNSFPDHTIFNAVLLLAEVNLKLGNKEDAQNILEDLIIKEPTSIYAVRAREILKENF